MLIAIGGILVDIVVVPGVGLKPGSDAPGVIDIRPGGVAANFAFWAAVLGEDSGVIGAVGRDVLADFALSDLHEVGVRLFTRAHPDLRTGCLVSLVSPSGEKSFVTQRAADEKIMPEDITEDLISRTSWLHIGGYALYTDPPFAATQRAIALAASYGVPISLDPCSWHLLREFGADRFLHIARCAAVLMPNYDEGRVLTGKGRPSDIALDLLQYAPLVVVKLGRDGCVIAEGEEARTCPTRPADAVVDSTGAGDAFDAAFVVEYRRSRDPQRAACLANALAREVVQTVGARPAPPVARGWLARLGLQLTDKEH